MRFYEIKVLPQQTLGDVAMQEYGQYEGINYLVEDNDLDGYESSLFEGMVLKIRTEITDIDLPDMSMLRYFRQRKIKVVNA